MRPPRPVIPWPEGPLSAPETAWALPGWVIGVSAAGAAALLLGASMPLFLGYLWRA